MKQKIFLVKKEKKELFDLYPNLNRQLTNISEVNNFYSQQINLLFEKTSNLSNQIYTMFYTRNDYYKIGNIHTLINVITNKKTQCIFHEYYLEIDSSEKTNSFLELICHITTNYVIIIKSD